MANLNDNFIDIAEDEDDGVSLIDSIDASDFTKKKAVKQEEKSEAEEGVEEDAETLSEEEFGKVLEEADKLLSERRYKEVLPEYQLLHRSNTANAHVTNCLARVYAIRGYLKKYIDLALEWSKELDKTEQYELANLVCQNIIDLAPDSLEARMEQLHYIEKLQSEDEYINSVITSASYFINIGEGERSISLLKMALDRHPARMELAVKLADIHMQLGNIKECTQQCRSIVAFYEYHKDYANAAELYRRLRMLVPNDIDVALRLSNLYFLTEQYEEAASEFRSCLHIAYDSRDALFGLAQASQKLEKYNDSSIALRKILADNEHDAQAREMLGDIFLLQDNKDEALKCYTAASKDYYDFKEYADTIRVLNKITEKIDAENAYAIRELANTKDALQQKEARDAKMAKIAEQAKASREKDKQPRSAAEETPKEKAPTAAAAFSEDDMYADDGPVGGFDGELDDDFNGSGEPDEQSLDDFVPSLMSGLVADKPKKAEPKKTEKKVEVTRVIVKPAEEGKLQIPVPFILASYPEAIPLMQQILNEPPSREIFGWNYLEDIDAKIQEEQDNKEEAKKVEAEKRKQSGPVASAFAKSGGGSLFSSSSFSASSVISSGRKKKKRRNSRDDDDEGFSRSSGSLGIQNSLSELFSND